MQRGQISQIPHEKYLIFQGHLDLNYHFFREVNYIILAYIFLYTLLWTVMQCIDSLSIDITPKMVF